MDTTAAAGVPNGEAAPNSKFVPEAYRDEFFKAQRSKLENRTCFDCNARNTTWLSTSYAIYLCLNCSSHHRRLGTHISFVRSCDLDQFTPDQLRKIEIGGNSRARTFFKTHGLSSDGRHVDYNSKSALKYRQMLDREFKVLLQPSADSLKAHPSIPVPIPVQHSPAPATGTTENNGGTTPTQTANSQNTVPVHRSAATIGAVPAARSVMSQSASTTGGSTAGIQARKLDIDFDFEQAVIDDEFAQSLPAPVASAIVNSNTPHANRTPVHGMSTGTPKILNAGSTSTISSSVTRFSGEKGISSERYFANESTNGTAEDAGRLAQFEGSRAISSTVYFGEARPAAEAGDEQIGQLSDSAREGLSNLSRGAQTAYSSAKTWFNQFGV